MNLKTSLVLALVFLSLGMLVFVDAIKWQPERIETEQAKQLIFPFNDKKVEWLQVKVPGIGRLDTKEDVSLRIVCENKSGCGTGSNEAWIIDGAERIPGDSTYIGALLASVFNVKRMQETIAVSEQRRLKENYVIEKENGRSLEIKFAGDEKPLKIVFGAKSPINSNYYLWSSANPDAVELIAHYFYRAIDRDAFHWQEKTIMSPIESDSGAVRFLEWRVGAKKPWIRCRSEADTEESDWLCEGETRFRASRATMAALFSYVRKIKAGGYQELTPQIERQLSLTPKLQIIAGAGETKTSLDFYQSSVANRWLVKTTYRDWIGTIDFKQMDRFMKPVDDYRDRTVISRDERDRVERVEIIGANDKNLKVTKSSSLDDILLPLSRPVVKEFHRLNSSKGKVWQEKAQWELQFFDSGNNLIREIRVWTEKGKNAILSGEAREEVREISKNWTEAFLALVGEK